ncbi:alanine racemase [Bacillaceae bacterium W0354]
MNQLIYRDTWAEINLGHIKHNIKELMNLFHGKKKVYAVVKADAYGHGEQQVAKAAIEAGASALAVAILEEAIRLREAFPHIPILVLGWTNPRYAQIAAEHNITLTVFQDDWVKEANQTLTKPLNIHLKIDTGMGRIGIRNPKEAYDVIEVCSNTPVSITGIYTHFATADEANSSYYDYQVNKFQEYLKVIQDLIPTPLEIHIGNSAASLRYPNDMTDAIRYGISMYGLYPSDVVENVTPIKLKPSFSLYSRLIHVKKVSKGERISYGGTYEAIGDEWIGTIPIGYGDGWLRKLQNFQVLIEGKRVPIVGRICMDQTMIRLDKPYELGTKVTLIGKDGSNEITMEEVADYLETINYEIPCIIGKRIPRVYK